MAIIRHNGDAISATVLNAWSREALKQFSFAASRKGIFYSGAAVSIQFSGSSAPAVDFWDGWVLYTGDTSVFRYNISTSSTGGNPDWDLFFNGVSVASGVGGVFNATVDLSAVVGLSLTAGTVYRVRVNGSLSGTSNTEFVSIDTRWLGFEKTIAYETIPTFADGSAAETAPAELNKIATQLDNLNALIRMPIATHYITRNVQLDNDGSEVEIWRGHFYYEHDLLAYAYRAKTAAATIRIRFYVNGTQVFSVNHTNQNFESYSGTVDIGPSVSLTKGNLYEFRATMNRTGTVNDITIDCDIEGLFFFSPETPAEILPLYEHGGQNISAANLNKYKTVIDQYHPAASSPPVPMYYQQAAIRSNPEKEFALRHYRGWIRYRPTGVSGASVNIFYGGNVSDLPGDASENLSFNLQGFADLVFGQDFIIDDVDYAQEWLYPQGVDVPNA